MGLGTKINPNVTRDPGVLLAEQDGGHGGERARDGAREGRAKGGGGRGQKRGRRSAGDRASDPVLNRRPLGRPISANLPPRRNPTSRAVHLIIVVLPIGSRDPQLINRDDRPWLPNPSLDWHVSIQPAAFPSLESTQCIPPNSDYNIRSEPPDKLGTAGSLQTIAHERHPPQPQALGSAPWHSPTRNDTLP